MNAKKKAAQVNPIVRKAADQITQRRSSKPTAKDLPRREGDGQLSLFDSSGERK
ncbi:hypothetical protein [Nocardia macrotermitis]|uniref:Uncharacterized protein n=1 Tax=Nocardia macrotermitis TaxID=2585198 RepID=A0A7K0D313_9NOCA|nr:hypothetical protein [Nocardia macrotermitis]MQY19334.1 hypothetical protein [Nocardia macrotermitis]